MFSENSLSGSLRFVFVFVFVFLRGLEELENLARCALLRKKIGAPGWLSWLSIRLLILAQVMI